MRAVVQRVSRCEVRVEPPAPAPSGANGGRASAVPDQQPYRAAIGPGLLAYLGVSVDDTEADAVYLANKLCGLRIFPDAAGRMERSVLEHGGEVMVVSQFTLYGDVRRGRRPGYARAAPPERAVTLYEQVIAHLRSRGLVVQGGRFRTYMQVDAVNDGPVTILLDSERTF